MYVETTCALLRVSYVPCWLCMCTMSGATIYSVYVLATALLLHNRTFYEVYVYTVVLCEVLCCLLYLCSPLSVVLYYIFLCGVTLSLLVYCWDFYL